MSGTAIALVLLSAALHATWSVAIKGSRDPLAFNLLQSAAPAAIGAAAVAATIAGPEGLALEASFW